MNHQHTADSLAHENSSATRLTDYPSSESEEDSKPQQTHPAGNSSSVTHKRQATKQYKSAELVHSESDASDRDPDSPSEPVPKQLHKTLHRNENIVPARSTKMSRMQRYDWGASVSQSSSNGQTRKRPLPPTTSPGEVKRAKRGPFSNDSDSNGDDEGDEHGENLNDNIGAYGSRKFKGKEIRTETPVQTPSKPTPVSQVGRKFNLELFKKKAAMKQKQQTGHTAQSPLTADAILTPRPSAQTPSARNSSTPTFSARTPTVRPPGPRLPPATSPAPRPASASSPAARSAPVASPSIGSKSARPLSAASSSKVSPAQILPAKSPSAICTAAASPNTRPPAAKTLPAKCVTTNPKSQSAESPSARSKPAESLSAKPPPAVRATPGQRTSAQKSSVQSPPTQIPHVETPYNRGLSGKPPPAEPATAKLTPVKPTPAKPTPTPAKSAPAQPVPAGRLPSGLTSAKPPSTKATTVQTTSAQVPSAPARPTQTSSTRSPSTKPVTTELAPAEPVPLKPVITRSISVEQPTDKPASVEAQPAGPASTRSPSAHSHPQPGQLTPADAPAAASAYPSQAIVLPTPLLSPTAEPFFEYTTLSTISSATQNISLEHPNAHLTSDVANTQAEHHFTHQKQLLESLGMQCTSSSTTTNDHGLTTHAATFTNPYDPSKTTSLTLSISRAAVGHHANRIPAPDPPQPLITPVISRTIYAVRLWRLDEVDPESESEADADTESTKSKQVASDEAGDKVRVYCPLPPVCTELHTTLDAANRAAKRVQVRLRHSRESDKETPYEKQWRAKALQDLEKKVESLKTEVEGEGEKGEVSLGDKGGRERAGEGLQEEGGRMPGCWWSRFSVKDGGADAELEEYELLVCGVGVSGPRNL